MLGVGGGGGSCKPEAWLKEKAVLRTRHMLLVPDKWCLTVLLASRPPPQPCGMCSVWAGLPGSQALTWRERAEVCSLGPWPIPQPQGEICLENWVSPQAIPLIPEAAHLPVEALFSFFFFSSSFSYGFFITWALFRVCSRR